MNKKLLKLIALVLVVVIVIWVFLKIVSVEETKTINTQDTVSRSNKALNTATSITSKNRDDKAASYDESDEDIANNVIVDAPESDHSSNQGYVDLSALRKSSDNGVRLISINDSSFSAEERQEILEKVNNLKLFGSLSGGKVTHEFANLELKRAKIEQEETSFQPIDNIIDKEFTMTGRIYSGTYSQQNGYSSVFRLYENLSNNAKIEFTEMYLDPKNNTVMEVIEETLNHSVNDVPMTFETIKNNEAAIVYNAQFNVGEKYYSFSAQGISSNDFEGILSNVITREQKAHSE